MNGFFFVFSHLYATDEYVTSLIQISFCFITDDKYRIMQTGELHIRHVNVADASTSYRCRTLHKMTGEKRTSTTSGRLFVTGKRKFMKCICHVCNLNSFKFLLTIKVNYSCRVHFVYLCKYGVGFM